MKAIAAPVRDRPVLMSGEMVRATLREVAPKTQTRRVVLHRRFGRATSIVIDARFIWAKFLNDIFPGSSHSLRSPYGEVGDRLWVRETAWYDREIIPVLGYRRAFFEGGDVRKEYDAATAKAPGSPASHTAELFALTPSLVRRPSIHMPRWASRITLEITRVRVERVQDISEADATAEGAEPILVPPDGGSTPYIEGYRALWDSLNAKRGYGWDVNPWVWAIEFRRVAS